MSILTRPNGFPGLIKLNDPRKFLGEDGMMTGQEITAWEVSLKLVSIPLPQPLLLSLGGEAKRIRFHPAGAESLDRALHAIHEDGLWHKMGVYGGCFAVRTQRGSAIKWSVHTWGLALDIDVLNNPLGAVPKMDASLIQIFESYDFVWGGRWARPDGMHFQFCSNY